MKWKPVKAMWAKGRKYGMLLVNIDEFAILKIEIVRLMILSYSPDHDWSHHERWNCVNVKIDVLFDIFSKDHQKRH